MIFYYSVILFAPDIDVASKWKSSILSILSKSSRRENEDFGDFKDKFVVAKFLLNKGYIRNMKHKWIVYATLALAFIFGGFLIGKQAYHKPVEIIERTDTLRVTDTIRVTEFRLMRQVVKDTILIPIPEISTIILTDTIFVAMERVERIYQDEQFKAQVSGINPQLDWVEVYPQTTYITKTQTQIVKTPSKWGIGMQAGYGISTKGLTPYVGVGVQYNLWSW